MDLGKGEWKEVGWEGRVGKGKEWKWEIIPSVGGGAIYATYAMACPLLQEGMPGIPTKSSMRYIQGGPK